MSDTISRQAAIDAIMGQPPEPHYPLWYAAQIEKLPAVQPDHVADVSKKVERTDETAQNVSDSDLISRKVAIDAIEKYNFNFPEYMERFVTKLRDAMKEDLKEDIAELPSAQPEQRWIPVERELPEDLAEVNVTWVNHEPEPYYTSTKDKPFTASAVYYKGKWYWYSSTCADLLGEYGRNDVDKVDDAIEITAWRPLPAPYKGQKNDSKTSD